MDWDYLNTDLTYTLFNSLMSELLVGNLPYLLILLLSWS